MNFIKLHSMLPENEEFRINVYHIIEYYGDVEAKVIVFHQGASYTYNVKETARDIDKLIIAAGGHVSCLRQ